MAPATDNYTIRIDNGRVAERFPTIIVPGVQNLSMNLYIIERESLIQLVREHLCAVWSILSAISWPAT